MGCWCRGCRVPLYRAPHTCAPRPRPTGYRNLDNQALLLFRELVRVPHEGGERCTPSSLRLRLKCSPRPSAETFLAMAAITWTAVDVEAGHSLVGPSSAQRQPTHKGVQGGDQVQVQPPAVAGVAGAVAAFGLAGQRSLRRIVGGDRARRRRGHRGGRAGSMDAPYSGFGGTHRVGESHGVAKSQVSGLR